MCAASRSTAAVRVKVALHCNGVHNLAMIVSNTERRRGPRGNATCPDGPRPNAQTTLAVASKDPADVRRVHRDILQQGTASKTGLAQTLTALYRAGMIGADALGGSEKNVKRKLREAIEVHANADTPYGKVVKQMHLGLEGLPHGKWDYCCPMALMYHLCRISDSFSRIMHGCSTPGVPMRLVLYIDECEPGNPLRPEKSRSLQCIYWAFVDWPQWLLQRTAAWPVFGLLRSTQCDKLPGKSAQLMKMVLLTFFPHSGNSFHRGLMTVDPSGAPYMLKSIFAGFLADDKAHKEIGDLKGASGRSIHIAMSMMVGSTQ